MTITLSDILISSIGLHTGGANMLSSGRVRLSTSSGSI